MGVERRDQADAILGMFLEAFTIARTEVLPAPTIRVVNFRKRQFEHHRVWVSQKDLLAIELFSAAATPVTVRIESGENSRLMHHHSRG